MPNSQRGLDLGGLYDSIPKKPIAAIIIIIVVIALVIFVVLPMFGVAIPDIKMVSGTEYISNEEGQIIVRLQDSLNNPINDANCLVSLLYPDKSFVFIDFPMQRTTVPGNYYYSFMTPATNGIYEESINCTLVRDNTPTALHISSSFHVSAGLNLIVEVSRSQREQFDRMVADFNATNERLNALQHYVDTNLNETVLQVQQQVSDVNATLQNSTEQMNAVLQASTQQLQAQVTQMMQDNFSKLYEKFRQSSVATATIFNDQNQ
jgi:hypothetical protein